MDTTRYYSYLPLFFIFTSIYITILVAQVIGRSNRRKTRMIHDMYGGLIDVHQVAERLQKRTYSIASLFNPSGQPEIWVILGDTGDSWAPDFNAPATFDMSNKTWVREENLFRKKLSNWEAWILDPDDEIQEAITRISGNALDLLGEKIGYVAAQKKDFALVNQKIVTKSDSDVTVALTKLP